MPRLPHAVLLQAYKISPLLPLVLRGSRDIPSAINELRWIREHVRESSKPQDSQRKPQILLKLCRRRARGEPLQYILGTQPFGELDIKCRPGVLIPRIETEAYTAHLAELLLRGTLSTQLRIAKSGLEEGTLNIVDFCSGSGCISLLLYSRLSQMFPKLRILGIDISDRAIALSRDNLQHSITKGHVQASEYLPPDLGVKFIAGDIFDLKFDNILGTQGDPDIIISNPPYISQSAFNTETSRSVRNWEPKLALVPRSNERHEDLATEDVFYNRLLSLHSSYGSKILLMEVGDALQALRVATLATKDGRWNRIEIWRDWPDLDPPPDLQQDLVINGTRILFKGNGKPRAVVLFRGLSSPGYYPTE